MTYQEINTALKEQCEGSAANLAYGDYDQKPFGKVIDDVFTKGGEDEGSDYRRVHHFVDHNVYIEVRGYYQSHYGTDFEDWDAAVSQVFPVQKTITVYE